MKKEFYKTAGLIILLLLVLITGIIIKDKSAKELGYQKKRFREFQSLMDEYRAVKEEVSRTEKKTGGKAIIDEINSLLNTTGLKEKVRSIKQAQKKETPFGIIEESELVLERLTMNELANIFYRIEQNRSLTVSRIKIKRTFESPELLNLTIMLSSLKGR